MNKETFNKIFRANLILLLTLVFLSACNKNTAEVDAYGNFEADETLVSAEIAGKILSFNISEGETLKQNQTIGLVDTIMYALQLNELEAYYPKINSNLANIDAQKGIVLQQKENLETDLKRIENMKSTGAATQKQYDDIIGNLKVIDKKVEAYQAQKNAIKEELQITIAKEQLIKEQLNKCRIKNPTKGTVIEKYAEQGEITAPGKPLYKIADLDKIILRAYVSGSQIHAIKLNQACNILIDKGEKDYLEFNGKVEWIANKAEFTPKIIQTKEERVNMVYAIKIAVKNDGSIKMGMPGEVIFNEIDTD